MRSALALAIVALCSSAALGQANSRHHFLDHALISHHGSNVIVTANAPRPLWQAITALNEQYGWLVDYEDPPYHSKYDLVDDTDPQWRQKHPYAADVTIPAGGFFRTIFLEPQLPVSPQREQKILEKIVADYNRSGNPGRFVVLSEGNNRFAIAAATVKNDAGDEQFVPEILNTRISIPYVTQSADATLRLILEELSAAIRTKVDGPGGMANMVLIQSRVTVGGENVPARALLLQVLAQTRRPQIWALFYEADSKTYALGVSTATHTVIDSCGNKRTIFVGFTGTIRDPRTGCTLRVSEQ